LRPEPFGPGIPVTVIAIHTGGFVHYNFSAQTYLLYFRIVQVVAFAFVVQVVAFVVVVVHQTVHIKLFPKFVLFTFWILVTMYLYLNVLGLTAQLHLLCILLNQNVPRVQRELEALYVGIV